MSCGVQGVTPEWVQIQHRDHGLGEGRGKYSGRWDKVSQSEIPVISMAGYGPIHRSGRSRLQNIHHAHLETDHSTALSSKRPGSCPAAGSSWTGI